jgi:hypothetical protein
MVKHALRESTSRCGSTESLGETEGLSDWQVRLDDNEGGSLKGLFTDNNTSALSEALVNTTYSIVGALDFNQEDGFLETRVGSEH